MDDSGGVGSGYSGADKRATFERLIAEGKLGALALTRNLRNMEQAGVDRKLVRQALRDADYIRVLPFRLFAAAKHAPGYEDVLDEVLVKCAGSLSEAP